MSNKMSALMEYGRKNGYFLNSTNMVKGVYSSDDDEQESYSERFGRIVDDAMVADEFRWILDRGLEPHLLDQEEHIESIEDKLNLARAEFHSKKAQITCDHDAHKFDQWVKHNIELKNELAELKLDVDKSFTPDEGTEEGNSTSVYNYLEMYIDRFKLSELAMIMDLLESMHANKDISWYMYVQCGLAVCARLNQNCPKGGWEDTLNNLKSHKHINHKKTVSYDDSFYASMNISMEDAIDLMRKARDLAAKNYMSIEDMYYQLMDGLQDNVLETGCRSPEEYEDLLLVNQYEDQFESYSD